MLAVCGGGLSMAQHRYTVAVHLCWLHMARVCRWLRAFHGCVRCPAAMIISLVGGPCVPVLTGVAFLLLVLCLRAAWLPRCPFLWQLRLAYAALVHSCAHALHFCPHDAAVLSRSMYMQAESGCAR